jgi:hypothetical protein
MYILVCMPLYYGVLEIRGHAWLDCLCLAMSSVWAQESRCLIGNYVEDQVLRSDASSAENNSSISEAVKTQLQSSGLARNVAFIHELLSIFVTSCVFVASNYSEKTKQHLRNIYIPLSLHNYTLRNKQRKKAVVGREMKKNQVKENENKNERKKHIKRHRRKRHVTSAKRLVTTCHWNVFLLNSSVI